MSVNTEAEKRAYKKFLGAGMTPEGACGLIGNLEAESDGFYFNRVEYLCIHRLKEAGKTYTDKTYTAAVDNGKISAEEFLHPLPGKQYGYGLAQWTSPGRKSGLYTLARQKGVSIADEGAQLEFLLTELEESYSAVLNVLKSTASIQEASDIVLKKFEIPADTGPAVCAGRAARGQKFYDNYVKTGKGGTNVTVRVSSCGHDENGRYTGGAAGDQSGTEWYLRDWYDYKPWNYVLRWKDAALGSLFADLAIEAAQNGNIGYDQNQRDTFWQRLQLAGYHPANIKTDCETDCSAGTIALIKAVGYLKGISDLRTCNATYTGDMMNWFRSAPGKRYFEVLTGRNLTDPSVARRGDINLNVDHHVNITVDNGANAGGAGTAGRDWLQAGDTGEAVKKMQELLINCGYDCGAAGADGDFGELTEKALKSFQKAHNLTADGEYGPKTKAALEAAGKPAKALSTTPKWTGKCTAKAPVRTWAGKECETIKSRPKLKKGETVGVCDSVNDLRKQTWYYVKIQGNIYGFVNSDFIERV